TAARLFLPVPWSYRTHLPSHCSGKQQRGETAPSSKSAGTDRRTESFSLTLASSDDEAPEEVTFEDSKSAALRSMKEALDTARREKELLKEKRRKRQELFQEQKVLKGNYTVTTVTERAAASFQQQTAEDFIQSRLYGAGSCRSTSNELLSLQNKKGRNKSAAVQFVRKGWGKLSSVNWRFVVHTSVKTPETIINCSVKAAVDYKGCAAAQPSYISVITAFSTLTIFYSLIL
uniref:Nucleolar protein 7 n=1 Tax=Dicentrarchus labrax TaxID=13489 RepID=A0A8P4FX92_DICLA